MTKQEKTQSPPAAAARDQDRIENIAKWIRQNERVLGGIVIGVAVVAAGVWFVISARSRREAFASRELSTARQAVDAGNLPLAASDLSKLVGSLGSTVAGQEAQLLLGEVRLRQGQAALAATELDAFVKSDPSALFKPQAYQLLGVALEQTGQAQSAGKAYEGGADAAEASSYSYLAASLLLDAARSYADAGDTAAAVRVLERVVRDHEKSTAATEARLRLGELGKADS